MTDRSPAPQPPSRAIGPFKIDLDVAQPVRLGDYLVSAPTNVIVDRGAMRHVTAAMPGGTDTARGVARAYQVFRRRLVSYLAGEAGIRQFLDVGVGIPARNRTHEIAQKIAPEARVVYYLNDPVGLTHAHFLLTSTPEGATAHIHHPDLDPKRILTQASETLDLTQPVAVLCLWVLSTLPRNEDAYQVTSQLLAGVSPGSYLAVTDLASDIRTEELRKSIRRYRQKVAEGAMRPLAMRSHAEVARYFDGLDMVKPGVVPVDEWRRPKPDGDLLCYVYGALGRKP